MSETSQSAVFDRTCEELERLTPLDRLSARGTVRLALKSAGFEARSIGAREMSVVVAKLLPAELASRGVADASGVCARLAEALRAMPSGASASLASPEEVFRRLGG